MKILELRLNNLNSLYGEWFIDFTHPEYGANGIFALIGPTGAGKSTLLDAICLALYGATPRLGKITKSGNEIMSRGTGECSAELVFSVQQGVYRCHWGQHRARRKPEGDLQTPRHEIALATGEKTVIEHQLKRVAKAVEEITGMDFDRFTRSILLAQGGFDTFLKADIDQKSKILEQITGTELYSRISLRVHERFRDEKDELSRLNAEIGGISLLDAEEQKRLGEELNTQREREKKLTRELETVVTSITWLHTISGLKKELRQLEEQQQQLNKELDQFKPQQERLAEGLKASTIDPIFATLDAARKKHTQDQKTLAHEQKLLPEQQEACRQALVQLDKAVQQTRKGKQEQEQLMPLINRVRLLDQRISDTRKALENEQQAERKIIRAVEQETTKQQEEEQKRSQLANQLEATRHYLKKHHQDGQLEKELEPLGMQLEELRSIQREAEALSKEQKQLISAAGKLEKSSEKNKARLQELEQEALQRADQVQAYQQKRAALLGERLPRELQTEKEQLLREAAFRQKIVDLEAERNKLLNGHPCPLCGAEHHPYAPYARGEVPELDAVEARIQVLEKELETLEQIDEQLHALGEEEGKRQQLKTALQQQETEQVAEKQFTEKQIAELDARLQGLNRRQTERRQLLVERFARFQLDFELSNGRKLVRLLESRLQQWHQHQQQLEAGEKQLQEVHSNLQLLGAVIGERNQELVKKQEQRRAVQAALDGLIGQRKELFQDKNPEQEERRHIEKVKELEAAEKKVRETREHAEQQLHKTKTRVATLEEQLTADRLEIQALEREFAQQLDEQGFAGEQQYRAASLSLKEQERITQLARELSHRGAALEARSKDLTRKLRLEEAKQLTTKSLEELEQQKNTCAASLNQVKDAVAACRHQLSENEKARARIKLQQEKIEARKKECRRWEKLDALIGSYDGKKYRNFAQGLTFELMVAHANRQLARMSDRYLLVRDVKEPLELNVIDNYQAGEVRSTRNLSGGESFLVSLTLALGLSSMASQKVRVDSLFLDEGFGTLDEEALETALETLAGLQQDSKLIGVISHVTALKERISTQIEIIPGTGGRSQVSGPGCARVR